MRILSIDPSVRTVGWSTVDISETDVDFKWGMWEISGINFLMRCADLRDYIIAEIGDFEEMVIEWPMFYDSERGHTAMRKGDIVNLAGIGMYIAGYFHLDHRKIHLLTAPEWKGSVPKQVTARKFFKQFGIEPHTVDHNAVDATMMLDWWCRKQNLIE